MAETEHFNIPVPVDTDNVDTEFYRLMLAWAAVDTILHNLSQELADKASVDHEHPIEKVIGLANALAAKMNADKTFSLDDLTDVDGASGAAVNYLLVMGADGKYRPSSAIAALGEHEHSMDKISGLVQAFVDLGTIVGRDLYISTSDPAGGKDGDLWFKV